MELYDAIFYRRTIKKYSHKNVNAPLMEEVKKVCNDITYLNKDLRIKTHVIERGHLIHFQMGKKCKVKAPHYIVVTSNKGEDYLQNIGFAMEKVVLQLTALGLATCWLDCDFEMEDIEEIARVEKYEREYGRLIDLEKEESKNQDEDNEEIQEDIEKPYAIIAFGYPEKEEKLFKVLEGKADRKKINQISKKIDEKWINILKAVRLSPSIDNVQPWMFYNKDNKVHIYQEKQKRKKKELDDMCKVSMGIALRHFDIACKHYNMPVEYEKLHAKKKLGKEYYISAIEVI